MRILEYVALRDVVLWIAAHTLAAASFVIGRDFGSPLIASFGCATAAMMAWPMCRSLLPVCYSVVVRGQWPRRK